MTSSQHLSKELKQFIKSIGEAKSKQQQDRIILAELVTLKPKLLEKNIPPKLLKEHLIRSLYIEMLGHNAPFAHIHAVNLTQDKNLKLKRIGYLMCSLFFTQSSELLMLLVATILKDLSSSNNDDIIISLTSLGNIMSPMIASAITQPVVKLVTHSNDLVRKKAIMVLQKIKTSPGVQIQQYKEKMKRALCDKEPCVMAAALNLYMEEIKNKPREYRNMASSFVIILKQVIQHKLPKEFDYHRLPAPWIQINLMKILAMLGKGDQKASEQCYTILEQALKRAQQTTNNISLAVTYQCVNTIATIYPNPSLLQQAATLLTKYLQPRAANNMKYLGIKVLSLLHKQNPALLESYQLVVVDCLESKDDSLKRSTLDLLYKMTDNNNVEIIVSKMLNTLHASTDDHFRNALVLKITELAQRFSTTHDWYLNTMQLLFELGSQYLSENLLNNFLKLVKENYKEKSNFGGQIVSKMCELLTKSAPTDFIIKSTCWIIGQIGASFYEDNQQKLSQLCAILIKCLQYEYEQQSTRKWVIDALTKLSSVKCFKDHAEVKQMLDKFCNNSDIEVYQRALESKKLAKYNVALRNSLDLDFDENMSFLKAFVQSAKQNGAKPYNRSKILDNSPVTVLRTAPYKPTKKQSNSFPFPFDKKQQEKEPQFNEQNNFKPIIKMTNESTIQFVQKKKQLTVEQQNKLNLAKNLFGTGNKGPAKPIVVKPTETQKKKTIAETTNDLI